MKNVLVVDDEPSICWGFEKMLTAEGHQVSIASSAEEALAIAQSKPPDLIVLDVRLPGQDGIAAIPEFKKIAPGAPVVIMTAFGDLEIAVEAVRQGAIEYLTKPFDLDEAIRVCRQALRTPSVVESAKNVSVEIKETSSLVGSSPLMQRLYRQIAMIADSDLSVLITGETGTGKELVARAIHRHSARVDGPYLAIAPVALSESLIESELFGHVAGAFTGASQDRAGLFELADGGTLLLDEIGDLPESIQVKLLRVLEHGEYTRVGDVKPRECNVRILAATNRNLRKAVAEGEFREDLFYRLSAVEVALPPLRLRLDDLHDLTVYFLRQVGHADPQAAVTEAFLTALASRPWEGNVRELRNVVEHASVVARGRVLSPEHIPSPMSLAEGETEYADSNSVVETWLRRQLQQEADADKLHERFLGVFEPPLLRGVLEATEGNRAAAAERLGIHRGTLRERLKRYGID